MLTKPFYEESSRYFVENSDSLSIIQKIINSTSSLNELNKVLNFTKSLTIDQKNKIIDKSIEQQKISAIEKFTSANSVNFILL